MSPEDERDPLDVLAGEPMLGPRQSALVDALTKRLSRGPSLSTADVSVAEWVRDIVGLPAPSAPTGQP